MSIRDGEEGMESATSEAIFSPHDHTSEITKSDTLKLEHMSGAIALPSADLIECNGNNEIKSGLQLRWLIKAIIRGVLRTRT